MSLEKCLIDHCSPTLASLKSASLFNYRFSSAEQLEDTISQWNSRLRGTGVELITVKASDNHALIYVFRRSGLTADLNKPGVKGFLRRYGYNTDSLDAMIERLSDRISGSDEFPHEIGLFLGYPLGDVCGFIQNNGRGCKCCGCWKVYCNECEAKKAFARFRKCREIYRRLWNGGRTVLQLTVTA